MSRWTDLTPRQRRLVLAAGLAEAGLKAAALRDLAHRTPGEVRGPRAAWAAGLVLVNGLGIAPLVWWRFGRR